MEKLKVCIIGAGNISNTRHIPALLKDGRAKIVGAVSDEKKKIVRTVKSHKEIDRKNTLLLNPARDIQTQMEASPWFMDGVDAVIIGTPPKQHFPVAKACLSLGKHVLVEKPMMIDVAECRQVMEIAKEKGLVLNVMHSFQFSNGIEQMYRRYRSGEFGELKSILELQLTNRDRRLPVWYNDLPLGLFYDEAAHFFYSARRFGGKLAVLRASAAFNENQENTPCFLQAQLRAGGVPVQMYMNFNSPICEWGLILLCEKKIAIYDYFKDILIVLKNDGQHLASDVLATSASFFFQFWKGFIKNGIRMFSHKLLYGHDICISKFIDSIQGKEPCFELSAELGQEVVGAMNEVVKYALENRR